MASSTTKYVSVRDKFLEKLPKSTRLSAVISMVIENSSNVNEHWDFKGDLSYEDRAWLAERLTWKQKFPDETNTFPGKRPRSIEDQRLTNGDEIPSCKNCTNLKLSIDQCPLMGVASCDRPGHPDFLIRYGRENFKGPGCPACRQDLKEIERQRQELAREQKELEQQRTEFEHKERERQEFECQKLEHRELERKEIELKEAERYATERQELERKELAEMAGDKEDWVFV